MALRSLSGPPSPDGNDDLLCSDPGCEVCWLWPRVGEERPDWLARLATHLTARHLGVAAGPGPPVQLTRPSAMPRTTPFGTSGPAWG